MFRMKTGLWNLGAGMTEGYDIAHGEDGPFTRRTTYLLVQAAHDRGMVHICAKTFADEAEAVAYLEALPQGWTPEGDPDWFFDCVAYGSEAYAANRDEEEYSRMDCEERRGRGCAG